MPTRITKKTTLNAGAAFTRSQAEDFARQLVQRQLERERLVADRDADLEAVKKRYTEDLDALDRDISTGLDTLEAWADANQHEFGRAESVLLAGHRCGWRLGNHAAKLLRGWTWKKVVESLEQYEKKVRDQFLRLRIDANKDAMIDARDDASAAALLRENGVQIVQERRFYLDPDREGQADKVLKAAS